MKKLSISMRVVDDRGYKGTVERINISPEVLQHYQNGLYYVAHDIDDNGYKVNTDGWYSLDKLKPIKELAQSYLDSIKESYKNGDIPDAWHNWCKLYDLYEPTKNMNDEERNKEFSELLSFTNQIEDKAVYAITDYGREQEYIKMGYYSEIETEEPDICDED